MQAGRVASGNRFAKAQSQFPLDPLRSAITRGRTVFVQPEVVSWDETQKRMNFREPEYVLTEPWWVTVLGCVSVAALFAFALIAV